MTYSKGSNVSSIGSTSGTCTIQNSEVNCQVTLPSITASSTYIADGWYSGSSKVGDAGDKYTVSNNTTLTAQAKADNITLSISTSSTTNSITVVANATADSGIVKYEFSKDGGKTWQTGTGSSYTYSGLTAGTSYDIQVRVTSNSGKTSSTSKTVTTLSIAKPTFSEEGTTSKTVTITYPSGCGSSLTCTYQKDDGSSVNVTSTTAKVPFTADGNIVAKVSDGTNTVSSSYTVQLERALNIGTVKGGSITLDKDSALLSESVNITTSPTSDFTYQGATLVCEDGSTKTITGTNFNMSECNSAVTVYPTWKKNDRILFNVDKIPTTLSFSQTLMDLSGTGVYHSDGNPDVNGHKYFLEMTNPKGSWSRLQMSSTSPIDITDYTSVAIVTWCSDISTVTLGITQNRNTWIQSPTGVWDNVGTSVQQSVKGENINPISMTCNISKYTGNWYITIQRLYTNSYNENWCNINRIQLNGQTYSYTNRGV